ncbi:hypothetical protein HPB49_015595 [Dermacentor silvarum]|uniref:Uncharacterized protein n=1 Tax=Dermacentor silvarum TaxID=543639 RepID=A0ACB8CA64_DERSI|nr:hypothetical protein HPB49_015595 [Dermacentor silvarum]
MEVPFMSKSRERRREEPPTSAKEYIISGTSTLPGHDAKSFVLAFAYSWFALGTIVTATFLSIFLVCMCLRFAFYPDPYQLLVQRCRLNASYCPQRRHRQPFGLVPERTLICTLGPNVLQRRAYPADGICSVVIFTHVQYDPETGTLIPTVSNIVTRKSWRIFQRRALFYKVTSFMPSFEWKTLLPTLNAHRAREINASLSQTNMLGLALLNVRLPVQALQSVVSALFLLQRANPGMFLALGASFEEMIDTNAASLVPTELLDAMVTPLRLFVLETHLPSTKSSGKDCVAGYVTPTEPYDDVPRLTLRGASAMLSHHAFTLVQDGVLTRCFSVLAGALVFRAQNASSSLAMRAGSPCSSWHLASLGSFCNRSRVYVDSVFRAAYSQSPEAFVTFESAYHVDGKTTAVMQRFVDADSPICLAVYAIDLDVMPSASIEKASCSERPWWCTLAEALQAAMKSVSKADP